MGDRANIVLEAEGTEVWLYTHSNGFEIVDIARAGVAEAIKGGRANDPQYAGRIITDVFLRAHADFPYTGAGVSGFQGDGGDTVRIDLDKQHVYLAETDELFSFDKFVNA